MHDDLQVTRFYEMERCLLDGQIPCRWVPDLGAGRGFPMFNYYAPLPYYVGIMGRWVGLSFMTVVKLTFLLGIVGSAAFCYWFVIEVTKSRWAAMTAAVLYIWVPYRAVEIYVRGALSESWALMWFPLILLAVWKLIKEKNLWSPLLAGAIAGLLLSHNIMALWFAPVIVVWGLLCWLGSEKSMKMLVALAVNGILGLGLASFFVLPALTEQNLIHTGSLTQDYFDFRNHFATVKQLFIDRSWGFGPSRPGPEDGMSFQIGWPHWWIAGMAMLWLSYGLVKRKATNVHLGLLGLGLAFVPMALMHARSVYVWEWLPFLAWTQFPWRILALANLGTALLAGWVISQIRQEMIMKILALMLMVLAVGLNWQYFKPDMYDAQASDEHKLSGKEWDKQRIGAILDYLPKIVEDHTTKIPVEDARALPLGNGTSRVVNFTRRSNFFSFDVETNDQLGAEVQVEIYDFPTWKVLANGAEIQIRHNNPLGLITFEVPDGKQIITGWFMDTKIRRVANMVSLLSFGWLLMLVFRPERKVIVSNSKLVEGTVRITTSDGPKGISSRL